eukprot:876786-Rhodomonas_salina.1
MSVAEQPGALFGRSDPRPRHGDFELEHTILLLFLGPFPNYVVGIVDGEPGQHAGVSGAELGGVPARRHPSLMMPVMMVMIMIMIMIMMMMMIMMMIMMIMMIMMMIMMGERGKAARRDHDRDGEGGEKRGSSFERWGSGGRREEGREGKTAQGRRMTRGSGASTW